jgi:ABC-2 type transport system permease protein
MSASASPAVSPVEPRPSLPVLPVRVPERSFRNELRAIKVVWHRDMLRFLRDKPRIVTALLH